MKRILQHITLKPALAAALIAFLCSTGMFAQGSLEVVGQLQDFVTMKKLDGGIVEVSKNGTVARQVQASNSGKFSFEMPLGSVYQFKFSHSNYFHKIIEVDTRNIPTEQAAAGFTMEIDITLLVKDDCFQSTIFDVPYGKARYNEGDGEIAFDFNYTDKQRGAVEGEMERCAGMKAKLAGLQKDFDKLMADGAAAMAAEKFPEAISKFEAAIKLIPKNEVAPVKLQEAKDKYEEWKKANANSEAFNAAIKAGDELRKTGDFKGARAKYQSAQPLKPNDPTPAARIKELDDLEAAEAKKAQDAVAAKRKEFDKLMAEGNNLLGAQKFAESIAKFETAAKVLPDDASAPAKVQEAKAKWEEWKKAGANKEAFAAALKAGDDLKKANDLKGARAKYNEAAQLLPTDPQPAARIKELDNLEAAEAQKAQDAVAAKRKEFDKLMADGNNLLGSQKFAESIAKFESAAKLLPDDASAPAKVQEAKAKWEEWKKAGAKKEAFAAALKAGDDLKKADDLKGARAKYNEAAQLLPTDPQPAERIKELDMMEAAALRKKQEEADKAAAAQQKEFDKLMADGESAMKGQKFQEAIDKFEGALKIANGSDIAQRKLKEAKDAYELWKKSNADNALFASTIEAGDKAKKAGDLKAARAKYNEAAGIKPADPLPAQRINELDDMEAAGARKAQEEAMAIQAQFDKMMKEGREAVTANKFDDGIGKFENALKVLPGNPDATAAIEDARKKKDAWTKANASNAAFMAAMEAGDKAKKAGELRAARAKYTEAANLKPSDPLPAQRIKELEELEAMKAQEEAIALQNKFDKFMADGAAALKANNFAEAIAKYENALTVLPGHEEATAKLAEAKKRFEEWKKNNDSAAAFTAALEQGDKLKAANELEDARSKYQEAAALKPGDPAPAQRLKALDELEAAAATRSKYTKLLSSGDQFMSAKSYEEAIAQYEEALSLIPTEQYPKDRIADARKAIEAKKALTAEPVAVAQPEPKKTAVEAPVSAPDTTGNFRKELDKRYLVMIQTADRSLLQNDLLAAKKSYQEALALKPAEKYPQTKLALIEKRLAKPAEDPTANAPVVAATAPTAGDDEYQRREQKANSLFDGGQLKEAKSAYLYALEAKPTAFFSKKRVQEIDFLLAKKAREDRSAQAQEKMEVLAQQRAQQKETLSNEMRTEQQKATEATRKRFEAQEEARRAAAARGAYTKKDPIMRTPMKAAEADAGKEKATETRFQEQRASEEKKKLEGVNLEKQKAMEFQQRMQNRAKEAQEKSRQRVEEDKEKAAIHRQ